MYALLILAAVHLFANQPRGLGWLWQGRFLSFAAGISFAYVFVDLLPSLEEKQSILHGLLPYAAKHAYVLSLFGLLFFYGIHTKSTNTIKSYWLPLSGYFFFNFLVGASLTDPKDPEIQPIALFTIAMAMHYFVRDHSAKELNDALFEHRARWLLVIALFAGYFIGKELHISDAFVAIAVSFISGGMILNALHYELPKREQVGYFFFVTGALLYTAILLSLGES